MVNWDGIVLEEDELEGLISQAFERFWGRTNYKDNASF